MIATAAAAAKKIKLSKSTHTTKKERKREWLGDFLLEKTRVCVGVGVALNPLARAAKLFLH
jgi:hypothetical protein